MDNNQEIQRIIYYWRRYFGLRDGTHGKIWLSEDLNILEWRIDEYFKHPEKFDFNKPDMGIDRYGYIQDEDSISTICPQCDMGVSACMCEKSTKNVELFSDSDEMQKHSSTDSVLGEARCKCGHRIPRGYGYYNCEQPVKCFGCGRINKITDKENSNLNKSEVNSHQTKPHTQLEDASKRNVTL